MPTVIPMLSYEDIAASADWLVGVFGFEEQLRLTEDDGSVSHVTLSLGDGEVMLGRPGPDYLSPRRLRDECDAVRRMYEVPYVVNGVLVYVDDVDAHCARSRQAGATVLSDVEDTPYGRLYRVEDLEGQRWMFMQEGSG